MKKARVFISIVATLALILVLVPAVALADEDTAGGQFTAGNQVPTVDSVVLWDTETVPAATTDMTPRMEYNVKVTVSDGNTLDDLDSITVTIYHDSDGIYSQAQVPGTGNTQTAAILTWTNPGTWTIDAVSSSGSWSIGTCVAPTLTNSTGTFQFLFTPGKVATETTTSDEWHIHAVADDGTSTDNNYQENLTMNWWGQLTIDLLTIDFGTVAPGTVDGPSPNFVLTNIANGNYQLQLKSSATWTGSATLDLDTVDESPGDAQLALEADDDSTELDAQLVTASYALYTDHANHAGPTAEAGTTVATNTLWLSLGATGIPSGAYTGTIYYQILTD